MSVDDISQAIKDETVLSSLLCRICATERTDECMNNLLTSIHNGLYFFDILQDCLQRSIARDNGFPMNICMECSSNLILVYNFRLMCNRSEIKFEEMLSCHSDSDAFEQNVEVTIHESEADVKPSYSIDSAAIENLRTNCAEVKKIDSKTEMIEPQTEPELIKLRVQTRDRKTEMIEPHTEPKLIKLRARRRNSKIKMIEPHPDPKLNKLSVPHYECYLCKASFKQIAHLQKHMTNYHKSNDDKLWSCSDCHKRFTKRNKLVEHFYRHISTKCEHCLEPAFTTLRDLRRHCQRTHKDQLVMHQCNRCPKKFVLHAQLRIHMHNHLDKHNLRYNCNVCSETFVSKLQLKGHIRSLHTTYLCSECGKTFKNNSLLTSHQKTHNSEKPFVCSKCPSRFKWRVALTYHMTIHTNARPHVCETCGMSFTTRTAMRGHASELASLIFF